MRSVKAKKHLGQHFLKEPAFAQKIAEALSGNGYNHVLEIGPGMGVLTQFLLKEKYETTVVELDRESVEYLYAAYPQLSQRIISGDFMKLNLGELFKGKPFALVGNYPYNISSQIVFNMIANREYIPEMAGMFQKEVAERIAAPHGSKTYGIISVLTQAYYDAEYLFTVPEGAFNPPPKVKSGVIRLTRKDPFHLTVDEKLFSQVVKAGFNQRRKTLRNALKSLTLNSEIEKVPFLDKRAEQLSVQQFIELTEAIQSA